MAQLDTFMLERTNGLRCIKASFRVLLIFDNAISSFGLYKQLMVICNFQKISKKHILVTESAASVLVASQIRDDSEACEREGDKTIAKNYNRLIDLVSQHLEKSRTLAPAINNRFLERETERKKSVARRQQKLLQFLHHQVNFASANSEIASHTTSCLMITRLVI